MHFLGLKISKFLADKQKKHEMHMLIRSPIIPSRRIFYDLHFVQDNLYLYNFGELKENQSTNSL